MLIDRTRPTLHPGDIKKVRKTNLKGNQMPQQRDRFISYPSITMEVNALKLYKTFLKDANKISDLKEKIKELKKQNRQLKQMINTTIGIAYDKEEYEAITYLVNEKEHYPTLFDN